MWFVSMVCLCVTALLVGLAVFAHAFDDNLLQRIGLGGVFFGLCAIARQVWFTQYVGTDELFLHVFLALFAAGTALKVSLNNRRGVRS